MATLCPRYLSHECVLVTDICTDTQYNAYMCMNLKALLAAMRAYILTRTTTHLRYG